MNNNPRFDTSSGSSTPEALESEIDSTRRRMDDTIDALASRLKGRHLVDEILGFFRSSSNGGSNGNAAKIKQKVSSSATTAMHSVVDTVKAHPLPTLLIGAGIAWMLVERRREASYSSYDYDPDYDSRQAAGYGAAGWEDDVPYDYTGSSAISSDISGSSAAYSGGASAYGSETTGSGAGGKLQNMKQQLSGKMSAAGSQLRQRSSEMSARARETASRLGHQVEERYSATRQRVATTVDQHPLESAIASLALGVVAGLLIPTPEAVRTRVAPTARRLRDQAREAGQDIVERGRHVADAAVQALKHEAEEQGLTPEALKERAGVVASRTKEATKEAANREGLNPNDLKNSLAGNVGSTGEGSGASASSASSGPDVPKSPNPPSSGF